MGKKKEKSVGFRLRHHDHSVQSAYTHTAFAFTQTAHLQLLLHHGVRARRGHEAGGHVARVLLLLLLMRLLLLRPSPPPPPPAHRAVGHLMLMLMLRRMLGA